MVGSERTTCVRDSGTDSRATSIRNLNDAFRRYAHAGVIYITAGVQGLGQSTVEAILVGVRDFDAFTSDNDPYAEHDFGVIRIAGTRVFWKIDYYDSDRRYGSPDPANPAVTTRVLTIMLSSEY